MPSDETVQDISDFLEDVRDDLNWLLSQEGSILVDPLVLEPALVAWRELTEETKNIEQAQSILQNADTEIFSNLDSFGFTDAQWGLKRSLHNRARGLFRRVLDALRNAGGFGSDAIGRVLEPIISRVLGVINKILKSLVKVIPVLDPIQELKETLEEGMRQPPLPSP